MNAPLYYSTTTFLWHRRSELPDGTHRLTVKGEAAYVALESGDGEVAEIAGQSCDV